MRLSVILISAALLAGCAAQPGLQARMAALLGHSEGDLVAALGVPVRSYEADGRKFLAFDRGHTQPVLLRPPYAGPWRGGWWGPDYGYATFACEVTFAIRNDRAESFSWHGDGCR